MDAGLENIIRRALKDARAAGRDHLTQTEEAVRAGRISPGAAERERLSGNAVIRE